MSTVERRAVSVLQVANPALWAELQAQVPLDGVVESELDPLRRVVSADFERRVLPALADRGVRVLVRHAHRDAAEIEAAVHDHEVQIERMRAEVRRVLFAAQRHALDGVVRGLHAWDPIHDAAAVRALHGDGWLIAEPDDDAPPYCGRYRLAPDLPPPPVVAYDFAEAVMDETDDLSEARPGPIALLHDLAALAAALVRVGPRRTQAGTLSRADARRIGRQLGATSLAEEGRLEQDPRWGLALQALEALGAVSMDPLSRELFLDLGLEHTLEGTAAEAMDRFVHRLLERDLHVVVPAVREALRQAGPGAIDELVLLELLAEQHRQVLFPKWIRAEGAVYPHLPGEPLRAWDDRGWERIETRMVGAVLKRMERLGVIRRAPGVFAGTRDGRAWAGAIDRPAAPVWVTSDLEVTVPPGSVTPWERFQLERLGRCLQRDVVDRYRLERDALVGWLAVHEVDEALDLLRRRSPAVPPSVEETLRAWARAAERLVLTRGVLLET